MVLSDSTMCLLYPLPDFSFWAPIACYPSWLWHLGTNHVLSHSSLLIMTRGLLYHVLSHSSYLIMTRGLLYHVLPHSSHLIMARGLLYQVLFHSSHLIMARGVLYHVLFHSSHLNGTWASARDGLWLFPPDYGTCLPAMCSLTPNSLLMLASGLLQYNVVSNI